MKYFFIKFADNVYVISRSRVHNIQVCSFSAKMCGAILKVNLNEIIKTLTVDAYNKRLFFVVVQTQRYGAHRSRIVTTTLDGSKREILLTKEMSFVTTLACDPYKKILYYTDMHQKNLQGLAYHSGSKNIPITLLENGNIIMYPAGLTWYENQIFIVNSGAREAIRCYLYGTKKCKAFNLNILNAEDILIDGASRQPTRHNPCSMAKCRGMCVQSEFSFECMCGDSIVSENKHCDATNEITSSALLTHQQTPLNEDQDSSHMSAAFWSLITILALLLLFAMGYIYYRRKKHGQRDFIRNLHFQNPLSSFTSKHGSKTGSLDSRLPSTAATFEVDKEKLQIGSRIQRLLHGPTSTNGPEILLETAEVGFLYLYHNLFFLFKLFICFRYYFLSKAQ